MQQSRQQRIERRTAQQERVKKSYEGSGIYLFHNKTGADLMLPKAALNGARSVAKDGNFKGDSWFLGWMGPPLSYLSLVEVIQPQDSPAPPAPPAPPATQETTILENTMNDEKLILDQPPTITTEGKVEQFVKQPQPQPLNDSTGSKTAQPEKLINENPINGPMSGVQIIRNQ